MDFLILCSTASERAAPQARMRGSRAGPASSSIAFRSLLVPARLPHISLAPPGCPLATSAGDIREIVSDLRIRGFRSYTNGTRQRRSCLLLSS